MIEGHLLLRWLLRFLHSWLVMLTLRWLLMLMLRWLLQLRLEDVAFAVTCPRDIDVIQGEVFERVELAGAVKVFLLRRRPPCEHGGVRGRRSFRAFAGTGRVGPRVAAKWLTTRRRRAGSAEEFHHAGDQGRLLADKALLVDGAAGGRAVHAVAKRFGRRAGMPDTSRCRGGMDDGV